MTSVWNESEQDDVERECTEHT